MENIQKELLLNLVSEFYCNRKLIIKMLVFEHEKYMKKIKLRLIKGIFF